MYLRHRAAYQGKSETDKQKLQELALADGQRALELNPDDDLAAQEVVWLCLAVGRFEDAERILIHCRERRPDDPWIRYLRARVCRARGATAEAKALLDQLLFEQPQFARGLLLRAVLHSEANESEKAIPLLRQVIAQDRGLQMEARYQLGLALARSGHADEARQVLAEVQRDNLDQVAARSGYTENPAVQVRRAELLLGIGQSREALALLQTVLRDNPAFAAAHHVLAAYYEKQGEQQKAAEHRRTEK
jgi:tetratricopeptide (TPR) repeat protein